MDPVGHPLDWWAYGGYAEVVRQTGWNLPKARREVRKTIRAYGWHPIGHRGYEALRRRIIAGELLDHDLTRWAVIIVPPGRGSASRIPSRTPLFAW